MRRVLSDVLQVLIALVLAGSAAAADKGIPKDEVLARINYWQGELGNRQLHIGVEFDWKGLAGIPTLNNTDEERGARAAWLVNQTMYGFIEIARDDELRAALAKDVKQIKIVHDGNLDVDPAVKVAAHVATVRFNYAKYRASNVGPRMDGLIRQALPSAADADRAKARKEIQANLERRTKMFRRDELLDLAFEVRWKELEGQPVEVWKGVDRMVSDIAGDLSHFCGYTSSKPVVKAKVEKVTFGVLGGKGAPPVSIKLQGKTLSMALPLDTLADRNASMNFREELMSALGIRELKN